MAQEKKFHCALVDLMQDNLVNKTLVSYNRLYNNAIILDKYGCKTTKFHQLQHVDFYTRRHGVWSNFNVSIGEMMEKELLKSIEMKKNKDRDTLSLSIFIRKCEIATVELLIRVRSLQKK